MQYGAPLTVALALRKLTGSGRLASRSTTGITGHQWL